MKRRVPTFAPKFSQRRRQNRRAHDRRRVDSNPPPPQRQPAEPTRKQRVFFLNESSDTPNQPDTQECFHRRKAPTQRRGLWRRRFLAKERAGVHTWPGKQINQSVSETLSSSLRLPPGEPFASE